MTRRDPFELAITRVIDRARRLLPEARAVTSIEYAIIASIIILALVTSVPGVAPTLIHTFNQIAQQL